MIPSRERILLTIEQKLPDTLGNWVSSGLGLSITEIKSPSFVQSPETVSVIRFYSSLNISRYVTGITVNPEASYVVSPEVPFDRLELPLTGIRSADRIVITAEFEASDGKQVTDTFVFENDDTFTPDDRLEVSLESDISATKATVNIKATSSSNINDYIDKLHALGLYRATGRKFTVSDQVRAGIPVAQRPSVGPPVFLISIDTLRWDLQEELEPLISALGGSNTVVNEPRTQGHWTAPSHASMFTGVHPGDHRYVGLDNGATAPINTDLTTISDVLHSCGYKTRGLVSHTRILPEVGFGHGFFQYRLENMSNWLTREFDARKKVDKLIKWVDNDLRSGGDGGLFYFLHIFDPHLPYVPPLPNDKVNSLQLDEVQRYRTAVKEIGIGPDSEKSTVDIDPELIDLLRSYYNASVEYTAEQVARLIDHLKDTGLFDESLIIVTGDHGEEFGEQGVFLHNSLYDGNIRPFMAVKPPNDAEWNTPTDADTIDILPTIARTVGTPIPEDCQGHPWQDNQHQETRISERIRPDWYNIAVEIDRIKAIFTYEENYPGLPTETSVETGPIHEEYYQMEAIRNGTFEQCDPDQRVRQQLLEVSREHALRAPVAKSDTETRAKVTQDTEERLEQLGYK
jgi:arylsulfatase A-like enzyme